MRKFLWSSFILIGLFGFFSHASAASRFWVGGSGSWTDTAHWSASSGGAGGQSVPGGADTATMDANSTGTITVNATATVNLISITMGACGCTLDNTPNNKDVTVRTFSNSGSGVRGFNMGNATWSITSSSATVWTQATITNLTFSANSSTIAFTSTSSAGTITFTGGTVPYNDIRVSTGTGSFSIASINDIHSLDFTGFGGTWAGGTQQRFSGSITLSPSMTVTFSGTTNFTSTSTTATSTITSNGVPFAAAITINASNTVQLADALSTTGNITLTAGGFLTNGFNVSSNLFSSSNANTRAVTLGTSTWTITGSSSTVWTIANVSSMTFSGASSTINFTYSGSTGVRTIATGNTANTFTYGDVLISGGSDTVTHTGGQSMHTFSFNGFTGTRGANAAAINLSGDYNLGSMIADGYTGTITFNGASVTQAITSNGGTIAGALTVNGTGNTVQLADSLAALGTLTMTAGTLDTAGKSIATLSMGGGGAGTKTITMTNSTWTLTGTGTVWSLNSAASTLNAGGSTLVVSDTSALSKSLNFGASGLTYGTVSLLGGAGTIQLQTAGTNSTTFDTLSVVPGTTVLFGASTTLTVANFNAIGTSANPIIFQSTTSSVVWNLVKSNSTPSCSNFLSIRDSSSSPANVWYAGRQSTNVSGNTGWLFDNCVDDYPNAGVSKVLIQSGQLIQQSGSMIIQ